MKTNHKYRKKELLYATVISATEGYLCYLLHNNFITEAYLQYIIAIVYLPLYAILVLLGALLWSVGIDTFKESLVMPFLKDEMWILGACLTFPVNLWLMKQFKRITNRKAQ